MTIDIDAVLINHSPASYVLDVRGIIAAGSAKAGGKAFALAASAQAGCPVPPFFAVLPEAIEPLGARLRPISEMDIRNHLERLAAQGFTRFAVRSSGRSEDGEKASHAGQFLTVLDVPAEGVPDAVVRVIQSGMAESVIEYQKAMMVSDVPGQVIHAVETAELPAVVVQGMVDASAAGVAFGADPVSGRSDIIVISAVKGLGDRLVGGEVDGATWRLSAANLAPIEEPSDSPITLEQARKVALMCLHAGVRKGSPQDVEWAFGPDGERVFHLQDRPITTRLLPSWEPERKLTVLDNSNIVESYPGMVSPLTFSFASMAYARVYRSFLRMIGVPEHVIADHAADLANMLSLVDGRMYYNLGNWYRLLSLLPMASRNRQSMETMMGVSQPIPEEALGEVRKPGPLAAGRMAWGLIREAIRLRWTNEGFMQRMYDSVPAGRSSRDLQSKSLSQLAAEYRRIEASLLDRWDAPIVNDFLCMMAYGASRKLMERWAGQDGIALHNEVMIGQGDIISAEPARLIREAGQALAEAGPETAKAFAEGDADAAFAHPVLGPMLRSYVDRFGDRRIGELKLESPTLSDDPKPLLTAIAAAAVNPSETKAVKVDPAARLAELFPQSGLKRKVAEALLSYAKARVRDRENLRFERTRIFGRARRVFLAMGSALAATDRIWKADDVFFLTVEEVLAAAEGNSVTHDLKGIVRVRQHEHIANAGLPDPEERILVRGSVGDRASRVTAGKRVGRGEDDGGLERKGTACGSGKVTGRVRVIRDPAEQQVRKGEILVARHTDPGWISHFTNAAAVVVERGSVLSHSAIVSRELGIPCVVALKDACTWLSDGDLVEVDGAAGTVRKVESND